MVDNIYPDLFADSLYLHNHHPILAAILNGIGDEVGQDLFDFLLVAVDISRLALVQSDVVSVLFVQHLIGSHDFLRYCHQIEDFLVQLQIVGLNLGGGKHVGYQLVQPIRFGDDDL